MRKCKQNGYEHIEIVDSIWFTPAKYYPLESGNIACIGIVKTKDTITKEIKSYIGYGMGKDVNFDEDYIIASGAKLKKEWLGDIINMVIER